MYSTGIQRLEYSSTEGPEERWVYVNYSKFVQRTIQRPELVEKW